MKSEFNKRVDKLIKGLELMELNEAAMKKHDKINSLRKQIFAKRAGLMKRLAK